MSRSTRSMSDAAIRERLDRLRPMLYSGDGREIVEFQYLETTLYRREISRTRRALKTAEEALRASGRPCIQGLMCCVYLGIFRGFEIGDALQYYCAPQAVSKPLLTPDECKTLWNGDPKMTDRFPTIPLR